MTGNAFEYIHTMNEILGISHFTLYIYAKKTNQKMTTKLQNFKPEVIQSRNQSRKVIA